MINIDREKWMSSLFTHHNKEASYRHPPLFETLISSFLLSAPLDYNLHLLIVGIAGTGKSTMERCIWHKFEENQHIVKCGQSTIKALVPSFKTSPPSCGSLLNADRIAVTDEFLRILLSVKENDREHQLGRLNELLDNERGTFGSGNGSITSRMSAKLLAVSNPIWYCNTMERLVEKTDEAFLSRFLIWFQSKEHAKMVFTKEGKQSPAEIISKDLFLGVFDYCQTFSSSYDEEKIKAILSIYETRINEDTNAPKTYDVFRARHIHHACCLIDGIIKTRCLTTQRTKFSAIDEDYALLDQLLSEMVKQWGICGLPQGRLK
jgi:ABC-type cobalamin/Fe3+-siderophores transport system ATPase subunit